jgi:MoxR-like ATPase
MNSSDQSADRVYLADHDLVMAAQVAMELGQPLLLTGDPGTGKTAFADHLASRLAPDFFVNGKQAVPNTAFQIYKFETKSTSVATDLFYRFDSMRRFQAAHDPKMSSDNLDYIAFEALGAAILRSLPWSEVSDLIRDQRDHVGPVRSVVLIDEIDKAPRDFPNDLLNEIDRMFFRIPEIVHSKSREVRRVVAAPNYRPVVVLTSNSERNLPAPFLRRCVFHHIRFPDRSQKDRLVAIVKANLVGDFSPLADSAIDFFYDIRDELQLEKLPTSHELIQWVKVLHSRRWFNEEMNPRELVLADLPLQAVKATFGVIAKTAIDVTQVEGLADVKLRRKSPPVKQ